MFEHLARFPRIIVTGPHRSGTTICARMIAADTGKVFVMERDLATPRFEGDTEPDLSADTVVAWLGESRDVVLQGATCFRWLAGLYSALKPDLAVVYVVRNTEDVLRSQMAYRGRRLDDPTEKLRQFQDLCLPNSFLVDYEALSSHPMFVEDRSGWAPRQTEHGAPVL
ncbi:hypothetical protein [Rhodobium gokarnense]|uniref:Sulfotransferase family protein n=1 Tax=Rhodobium gokarnense TaxID=364296 RepID=A0ABT3HH47_9HYPH|nr:hypothetical protein [Rhodobium gokarnense]MCW2309731.1 hypothetical protein [Rhodobium gokarnense]